MKDFFSEYGKLIIVGALVILVLMFSTPFGQAVTQSISYFTAGFAGKNNASLEEVYIGPRPLIDGKNVVLTDVDGDGIASKGDKITFDASFLYADGNTGPTEFLVLNTNGSDVELLAKTNYQTSKFNTSSVTTTDSAGNIVQKYEDSTLDTLLNTTYFNSLSSTMQSKIKTKSITQNTWQYNGTPADATVTGLNSSTYTYKKTGVVGSYDRKVYALDVEDVKNYLGDTFTGADLNNMFFGTNASVSKYAWLRSACSGYPANAFGVYGSNGILGSSSYYDYGEARPAFTITLN